MAIITYKYAFEHDLTNLCGTLRLPLLPFMGCTTRVLGVSRPVSFHLEVKVVRRLEVIKMSTDACNVRPNQQKRYQPHEQRHLAKGAQYVIPVPPPQTVASLWALAHCSLRPHLPP